MSDPRSHTAWQRTRAAVLSAALRNSPNGIVACSICREPIDFTAKPRSSRSPSVDHHNPLSNGATLHDPTNLLPAHYGCNAGKRDRVPRSPNAW